MEDFDVNDTDILSSNENMYTMFLQSINFEKDKLYDATKIFKQEINNSTLQTIISEIPDEWELKKSESDALIEYLLYRVTNIEYICNTICNYLKIR